MSAATDSPATAAIAPARAERRPGMSLPNKLTLARVVAIPFLLFFLLAPVGFAQEVLWSMRIGWADASSHPLLSAIFRTIAFVIAVAATVTDYLDGYLARKYQLSSSFGKLMDPLADKMLVTASFVALVELGVFPSWVIIIILCREFLISGLRSLAASKGVVLGADRWGKHKTGWQLGTILTAIGFLAIRDFLRAADVWGYLTVNFHAQLVYDLILLALLIITVGLSIISGWRYLARNWGLVMDDAMSGDRG